jgi:hypothetical protein
VTVGVSSGRDRPLQPWMEVGCCTRGGSPREGHGGRRWRRSDDFNVAVCGFVGVTASDVVHVASSAQPASCRRCHGATAGKADNVDPVAARASHCRLEERVELQLLVHEATQLASSTQVRRDGWLRRGLLGTEEEQVRGALEVLYSIDGLDVRPRVELCSFSTLIKTQMLLFLLVSVRLCFGFDFDSSYHVCCRLAMRRGLSCQYTKRREDERVGGPQGGRDRDNLLTSGDHLSGCTKKLVRNNPCWMPS